MPNSPNQHKSRFINRHITTPQTHSQTPTSKGHRSQPSRDGPKMVSTTQDIAQKGHVTHKSHGLYYFIKIKVTIYIQNKEQWRHLTLIPRHKQRGVNSDEQISPEYH
ncbi:hypothetical protein AVEN_264719-1 [Araneus ventricosus]|uniref:Uncharacterized protein n=1 Tax=Araneus ventricosus TaxID=182803 RepID=A0A4Y2RDW6_ARAVE|nr:hypothetical protein AVEN_264719-1 [Araneus ventricosus]